jgi:hypothetical protein
MKVVQVNGKSWTPENLKELIKTNDHAVQRAILAIYAGQVEDEKRQATTKYHNGKGFTPADARFLSSLAKQIEMNSFLSPKQIAAARPRLYKYAGQIFRRMESQYGAVKI